MHACTFDSSGARAVVLTALVCIALFGTCSGNEVTRVACVRDYTYWKERFVSGDVPKLDAFQATPTEDLLLCGLSWRFLMLEAADIDDATTNLWLALFRQAAVVLLERAAGKAPTDGVIRTAELALDLLGRRCFSDPGSDTPGWQRAVDYMHDLFVHNSGTTLSFACNNTVRLPARVDPKFEFSLPSYVSAQLKMLYAHCIQLLVFLACVCVLAVIGTIFIVVFVVRLFVMLLRFARYKQSYLALRHRKDRLVRDSLDSNGDDGELELSDI